MYNSMIVNRKQDAMLCHAMLCHAMPHQWAIEAMHRDTRAKVVTSDGDSAEFVIQAGVLQWDTLAPFLFVIALDYMLTKAIGHEQELGFTSTPRKSKIYPGVVLADLDNADDICLMSDKVEQTQKLLREGGGRMC